MREFKHRQALNGWYKSEGAVENMKEELAEVLSLFQKHGGTDKDGGIMENSIMAAIRIRTEITFNQALLNQIYAGKILVEDFDFDNPESELSFRAA